MTDISNEIKLGKGKANPFGFSCFDLMHKRKKIGVLYCGEPQIEAKGYRAEMVKDGENIRLKVWKD